jgi:hypothetical protein
MLVARLAQAPGGADHVVENVVVVAIYHVDGESAPQLAGWWARQ